MRILYVTEWFATPDLPGLSRAYEFARAWTRAGHDVTVVTGSVDHLSNRAQPSATGLAPGIVDGVRVIRVGSFPGWPGGIPQRAVLYSTFAWNAYRAARRLSPPDIVIGSTPPPTVGLVANRIARRFGVPFVYELRDLWPDRLLAAGQLKRGLLSRWLATIERTCLRRAAGAVFVTRGDEHVARSVLGYRGRSIIVHHGVDHWMAGPIPSPRSSGTPFTCVYAGAHGPYNRLADLLAAAGHLRDEAVRFVFIGDGDSRAIIEKRARTWDLDTVRFRPLVSKRDAFTAMCRADACLLASGPHRHYRRWLPNKAFDYLASGTPIVASAQGELARLIGAAGGTVVPAGEVASMTEAIRALRETSPERRRTLGLRAREHALRHYRRSDQALRELAWLEEIVSGNGGPATGRPAAALNGNAHPVASARAIESPRPPRGARVRVEPDDVIAVAKRLAAEPDGAIGR